MHFTLKRSLYLILFITILAAALAGCVSALDGRPSIGSTVEDESVTNVDIESQTRVSVKIQSGSIKIKRADQGQLHIIEKRRLKGPASQERLTELLEKSKRTLETSSMSVNIETEATEEPLYRQTVQMEIIVPESIRQIDIDAENASVELSGFDEMLTINLSIGTGAVHLERCSTKRLDVSVEEGNIYLKDVSGFGTYECGRGDILLSGVTGAVDLKSVSGDTLIEESEGKLNCDISTGTLTVKDSVIEQDSVLYASYGNISADFEKIGVAGECKIMAAKGDISVNLPENDGGWSLSAKSTKGRIKNKMDPKPETLESVSSSEVYGHVRGGGPLIDIYVDNGDILLE